MKACTILPTILLLTKDSTCSTKPATQTGKFYFPKITQEDPAYNSSFLSMDSELDAQSFITGNKSLLYNRFPSSRSQKFCASQRQRNVPYNCKHSTGKVSEGLSHMNF